MQTEVDLEIIEAGQLVIAGLPGFRVLVGGHQQHLGSVACVARYHARGIADITVRQNIQLHWVTVESLPELIEALWSSGLTTIGACGGHASLCRPYISVMTVRPMLAAAAADPADPAE